MSTSNGHKALLVAALLAGLAACTKSVAVAVNLVTVGCAGSPDPFNSDGGGGLPSVQFLSFDVSVDGGSVLTQMTAVGSQTLQIPQLPLGTMEINVQGLSSSTTSATVVSEGNSGPFVIPSDGSVSQLSVTVFLRPTNAFSFTNSASTPGGSCSTMVQARAYHSQALLPNGQVLIYGGLQYLADPSDPTQTVDWTQALAMPPMIVPNTQYLASAEIYDPQTGEFTGAGEMFAGDSSSPAERAFSQMIPFTNGGAVVTGGEFGETGTALAIPAWNGGAFSPSTAAGAGTDGGAGGDWSPIRTASPHDHGCLAHDANAHALVAGGYSQIATQPQSTTPTALITTPVAEFFDPTTWPPTPDPVANLSPAPNDGKAATRADQACSGFDGIGGPFPGLVLEIGGVVMDPTGTTATIDQDYVIYGFQGATTIGSSNFAPDLDPQPNVITVGDGGLDAGAIIFGNTLAQPRARAKAAAMIVTEPATATAPSALGDAVLVTGGFTCSLGTAAGCAPAFLTGLSGQLANPPYSYFDDDGGVDVGITTELLAFAGGNVNPGAAATNMQVERIDHCAVPLPDGRVVVLGGLSGNSATTFGTTKSAEVFSDDPLAPTLPAVQSTAALSGGLLQARAGMACTLLQDGSILVTGGFQTIGPLQGTAQQVTTLNTAEIYRPLPITDGGL
jgi:hypothetical protein